LQAAYNNVRVLTMPLAPSQHQVWVLLLQVSAGPHTHRLTVRHERCHLPKAAILVDVCLQQVRVTASTNTVLTAHIFDLCAGCIEAAFRQFNEIYFVTGHWTDSADWLLLTCQHPGGSRMC
jgi:hypothetical protein